MKEHHYSDKEWHYRYDPELMIKLAIIKCFFLQSIKENNPNREIILILDNFPSHYAAKTKETASNLFIRLVFLPPYSPDLNSIESIWKSIKKVISREFIKDVDHLKFIIKPILRFFLKT